MIIAIEGCDASGKATQSRLLAERLGAERIAFPDYETPAGKAILGLLKEEWGCYAVHGAIGPSHLLNALVLQSLMTTNRLELMPRVIDLVNRKRPIVFDRYWASGLVYGALDGLDPEWIDTIQAPLAQPHAWVYLDVPPEESVRRRPERRDRYEKEPGFQARVRAGYLALFEKMARAGGPVTWATVDGVGTVAEVQGRIAKALRL